MVAVTRSASKPARTTTTARVITGDGVLLREERKVRVDSELLQRPLLAWPTVVLWCATLALWSWTVNATLQHAIPRYASFFLSAVCIFLLFTPLHDSAHVAIGHGDWRWVNPVIGRISALAFVAPYNAFKWVHLQHHKHTNDPDKDPDFWSGRDPVFLRPLRWACQELHYYVPYFRNIHVHPVWENMETISTVVALLACVYLAIQAGYGQTVLWCWIYPSRLAICFLAYSFDYIPHRPHKIDRKTDPYRTTSKVDGIFGVNGFDLTPVLMYQNYHNIHHLYPMIPFYRYAAVWWRHRKEFIAAGTPVVAMYDPSQAWY